MRRLWVFVILFTVTGVLVGGYLAQGVIGEHRLAGQRADYAAGIDASHRADCPRALRLLSAARTGGSVDVAAAAARERRDCQFLQLVESHAAKQPPALAVFTWINYLSVTQAPPYQAVARKAARTLLTSQPLTKIITEQLCWRQSDLAKFGVLSVKPSDPLAPGFLSSCMAVQVQNDPKGALRMYLALRKEFPELADNGENLDLLSRAIKNQLTAEGIANGKLARPDYGLFPLGDQVQLILINARKASIQIMLAGRNRPRIITIPGCASCSRLRDDKTGYKECNQRQAVRASIVVPAGHYVVGQVATSSADDYRADLLKVKPNRRYEYCWWI